MTPEHYKHERGFTVLYLKKATIVQCFNTFLHVDPVIFVP